jgi:hypothetical protein
MFETKLHPVIFIDFPVLVSLTKESIATSFCVKLHDVSYKDSPPPVTMFDSTLL